MLGSYSWLTLIRPGWTLIRINTVLVKGKFKRLTFLKNEKGLKATFIFRILNSVAHLIQFSVECTLWWMTKALFTQEKKNWLCKDKFRQG